MKKQKELFTTGSRENVNRKRSIAQDSGRGFITGLTYRDGRRHTHRPYIGLSTQLTFWRRNYFLNFSTPVYKMRIIQEPNTLEL